MSFFKKQLNIIIILITLIFLLLNITNWKIGWLGWVLFFVYFLILGKWWQEILRRVFSMSKKIWLTGILSWFIVFILLGLLASVDIVFYKLTDFLIWAVYADVTVLTLFIYFWIYKKKIHNKEVKENAGSKNLILFNNSIFLLITYLTVWVFGFILLLKSKSSEIMMSPWQGISEYYLPIFFVLTVLSGLFLFSKYKSKVILSIFILQSIILHLYLPLSHEMPWGGDVWRHISVENQIKAEQSILPVLIGPEAEWQEVVGVDLPKVFFSPQKYSYGHLWGTSVLLSETLQVDLLSINRWLLPIVWSLVMPLILFRIGYLLFGTKRKGLWLIWLSFLAFPFQVLGSLTLPVSLGYMLFLFSLMLWLQYLRDDNKYQKYLAILFSTLMLFSYSLAFILIWLVILISWFLKKILNEKFYIARDKIGKFIWQALLFSILAFVFPVIELVSGISYVPYKIEWWNNIKQLLGQFTGWFYASAIRPHDILSGNILFNHTPDYAFVSSIFNSWRWWIIPFSILIWSLTKFGFFKALKDNLSWKVMLGLVYTVFGGYIIGWFILSGDRLFTRRMDLVFSFLIIVFLTFSLQTILQKLKLKKIYLKLIVLFFVIIFSWFTTISYASGPDMRVISTSEYQAADYVWSQSQEGCVLADTWFLLALEAKSAGGVVGGGFPIDYQFGQTERVKLFNKFTKNPEAEDLIKIKKLANLESCLFIQKSESFTEQNLDKINEIFEQDPKLVSGMFVWGLNLKKEVE
jgi:hypothetical protein